MSITISDRLEFLQCNWWNYIALSADTEDRRTEAQLVVDFLNEYETRAKANLGEEYKPAKEAFLAWLRDDPANAKVVS